MEKIVFRFEPELLDYSHATRAYLTRRRSCWIMLGISFPFLIVAFGLSMIRILEGDFGGIFPALILLLMFAFLTGYPSLIGRLFVRRADKKEQLILPVVYEIDEDKIAVASQLLEVKYSWDVFNRALENERYYFLGLSSNKNMVQFIPKRAFESQELEKDFRVLLTQKLGMIENIQTGLRGWKLSLFVAVVTVFVLAIIVAVVLISIFGFDGSPIILREA